MKRASLLLALAIAAASSRADVTNVVAVVELGRLGTGSSADGWEVTGVSNYSESYWSALKFGKAGAAATSPAFPERILRVELKTTSSSDTGRRLLVTPLSDDGPATNLTRACAYSPTKNIRTAQSFAWPGAAVRRFALTLEEHNGSTAWGVVSMSVITADPAPARRGLVVRFR